MKQILLTGFCTILFISGCVLEKEVEERSASHHSVEQERTLTYKKPLRWEVEFIDERLNISDIINLNEYGYVPSLGEKDPTLLGQLARKYANKIDQPMKNPTIDEEGNIIPGTNRIILLEEELVNILLSLHYNEKSVILPIYETEPTVKVEDLEGIKDYIIGTYTTYFNPGVQGRSKNIKLSSQAIQHHVLGPGDEFSFNKVVGQRTRERGYQEAKEIVGTEFVMGIGGGICQTSSTLFNAIDVAGLEVIERHAHSRDIGYVPRYRDATVSWGGPDFRFINPYHYPILLRTEVSLERGEITVKVYSSQEKDKLIASR